KYIRLFLPMIRDQNVDVPGSRDLQAEVEAFLGTLLLSPVRLNNLQIVVFEMEPHPPWTSGFLARLAAERATDRYPAWVRWIKVLDLASHLSPESFFFYDDHLTATGHRNVADALLEVLQTDLLTDHCAPPNHFPFGPRAKMLKTLCRYTFEP